MNKLLLLGSTGKMGRAVKSAFENDYDVVCKNSKDFNACDFEQVRKIVSEVNPDIVINTVAFLGIDPCEKEPDRALLLNASYPGFLAGLSNEMDFLLIHFSTDAVFNDEKCDYYVESDSPAPINIYGLTKYGGDCFIRDRANKYYIFRIAILFGETEKDNQFVEKMLKKAGEGKGALRISGDIISSPSYTFDIAAMINKIIEDSLPFGTYHVANEGKASLYDLMKEIIQALDLNVHIEKTSHKEFSSEANKNTFTPIRSEKISQMRPWHDAVRDYCSVLKEKIKTEVLIDKF